MKLQGALILPVAVLGLFTGCNNHTKNKDNEVVSERYIHKYGYDVSKQEWSEQDYPGQVVTTQRNGVSTVSSFDGGILHGPTTETYPHSQTLKSKKIYDKGILTKQIFLDIKGIPEKQETYTSPTHMKVISWYSDGTPRYQEEYASGKLINGQYFTITNEVESRVEDGVGVRIIRDQIGRLKSRQNYERSEIIHNETYHVNNTPMTSVSYNKGVVHGEKLSYSSNGAPLFKENYNNGKLNGISTYYQNGYKYLEIPYASGEKDGVERHYIDGETISEETIWNENMRHGPSVIYCDGISKTEWYYNDQKMSKHKYEELCEREDEIARLQLRSQTASGFLFLSSQDS